MTFRVAQISDTHLSEEKPFFVDNFDASVSRCEPIARLDLELGRHLARGASNEDDLAVAAADA